MKNYTNLLDADLISLLGAGDLEAFIEIYTRYFYLLFTTLWLERDRIINGNNQGGYLSTSIRNRTLNHFAQIKAEVNYATFLSYYHDQSTNQNIDYLIREEDFQAYIEIQIQKLPEKMRRVFELSRKDQVSHKEIAERLNLSENNVSRHINGALRILKKKLPSLIYFACIASLENQMEEKSDCTLINHSTIENYSYSRIN